MDEVLQRELQRSYTPEQMNEFTVVLELKYLAAHAPNGVFIGNDRNNLKKLHGLIFIKRGLYQDGVFRFVIDLPSSYNSIGSQPIVKFTSKIYNPFVDAATGLLDLKLAAEFSRWDPSTHSLTTIATTVKRIFLIRSFEKYASRAPNEDAAKL
jgi:ubiquitin-protein ligase